MMLSIWKDTMLIVVYGKLPRPVGVQPLIWSNISSRVSYTILVYGTNIYRQET